MADGIVEVDAHRIRALYAHDERALLDWLGRHGFDANRVSAVRVYPLGCVTEVDVFDVNENGARYLADRRTGCERVAQHTETLLTFDDPAPIERFALVR